ncbi:hypothetical protein ACLKA7_011546 [Drosophila subpalustris]
MFTVLTTESLSSCRSWDLDADGRFQLGNIALCELQSAHRSNKILGSLFGIPLPSDPHAHISCTPVLDLARALGVLRMPLVLVAAVLCGFRRIESTECYLAVVVNLQSPSTGYGFVDCVVGAFLCPVRVLRIPRPAALAR